MSRSDYQFVPVDADELVASLEAMYAEITGTTVLPASPEKLFIQWVAGVLIQERALINYAANQNIPARAEGENLDALGGLFFALERPEATAAVCTMKFTISEAQETSILVPRGTRVTDDKRTLVWATLEDVYVEMGSTEVEAQVRCQTPGSLGNGYAAGSITQQVEVFDYYQSCENITVSGGGSDRATDEEYYEILRTSQDAYSTAGPRGAYIYHAKKVSTDIADVVPTTPEAGVVKLYVLMNDGTIANEETKRLVLEACNDDTVRPLTDKVSVEDPDKVEYNLDVTYYISKASATSASDIEAAVNEAVEKYTIWQSTALGRDINPSYLIQLLMEAGVKRVVVKEPAFTELKDGSTEGDVPQVAQCSKKTITNGGYEDE